MESQATDDELLRDALGVFYPCAITPTRYGGAYEGARWAAFRAYPEKLPAEAFGDDVTAAEWWGSEEAVAWVGVGATPDEAFRALVQRWAAGGCSRCRGLGRVRTTIVADLIGWRVCDNCAGAGRDEPTRCSFCGAATRTFALFEHYDRCPDRRAFVRRYPEPT